jgi:hypothetical protein
MTACPGNPACRLPGKADDGEQWGRHLEICHDDPGQDMNDWETELAFMLAD